MKKKIASKIAQLFLVLMMVGVLSQAFAQASKPSSQGAVLKSKAPVNKEILKVKLPKPTESIRQTTSEPHNSRHPCCAKGQRRATANNWRSRWMPLAHP